MHNLLIGDRRPSGAGTISVTEPALGRPMAEVASAGPGDLDAAVAAASIDHLHRYIELLFTSAKYKTKEMS